MIEQQRRASADVNGASVRYLEGAMSGKKSWRGVRIFTIGHSTRPLDELVALLRAFEIAVLADIRTIPRSRNNPQFNGEALRQSLRSRRLRYVQLPELGGLRRSSADSPNTGWRNASFRGYADYMLSEEFEAGLAKLHELSAERRVALMCAEAVPWRCHRSLVADALTVRGAKVEHIMSAARANPHRLTPFARVEGKRLTYPPYEEGVQPEPAGSSRRAASSKRSGVFSSGSSRT